MGDGSKKHVCVFTTLHTLPFQVFDSIGYNIAHRTLRCIVRLLRLDSIEIKLCISHFETTNGARGAGVAQRENDRREERGILAGHSKRIVGPT